MKNIPDKSINLILCDLPYGSTNCPWDQRIPLEPLWQAYERILSPTGVILLTADIRLATSLLATAPTKIPFRYDLVWDKVGVSGYLDANRRPLRQHELILVFGPIGYPTYNPQMTAGKPYVTDRIGNASVYGQHQRKGTVNTGTRYPTSILRISKGNKTKHPTEKPTALTDWLIKTYSNQGETVLDNCMGYGGTGVSALTHDRNFIGIEKDEVYFKMAEERIEHSLLMLA